MKRPSDDAKYPPRLIEVRARETPDHVWGIVPRSESSYAEGFREITYAALMNAVNGASHFIQEVLGEGAQSETIAYFGDWDPRYVILLLGAARAGHNIVFPSPRYPTATLDKLLVEELGVRTIITSNRPSPTTQFFISKNGLRHVLCRPLLWLLDVGHPHFDYKKSYMEAANDVLVTMHTSGSTREPKPVVWTNSWCASFLAQNTMTPTTGFASLDELHQNAPIVNMLPVLHCGNLFTALLSSLNGDTIVHYPLPRSPLSPETFLQLVEHIDIEMAVLPSPFVEYIASDPSRIEKVAKHVPILAYAGGQISERAAGRLADVTKIVCIYASTENGIFPTLRPEGPWETRRWRTLRFHSGGSTVMEQIGSNQYEAVVVRDASLDPEDPRLPPCFKAFPSLDRWRTKDVFRPDPKEPGAWLHDCRIEDIITFDDGATFNPLPYEEHVNSDPSVSAALLFGLRKPNAALLLEPVRSDPATDVDPDALVERIWPSIEAANKLAGGDCVVDRTCIIVARPDKEIPKAYKGTLQRGKARTLYQAELDGLLCA